MKQLREFAEHQSEFDQARARVLAISVDDQEHAKLVSDKQVGRKFSILSDTRLATIREYGLFHPGGKWGDDIAVRATIVLDKEGVERWRRVSENVPDIPTSADVLAELRKLP
jgi:peroxiredoxin